MLVLTRKIDESIVLGNNIEVKVLGIEEGKVKIGISAPKDIEIYRKEIYLEIQEENKTASGQKQNLDQLKDIFKK
ncbi:carbon storage regulator CsrA [Alkaliphilus peptidifermentans]|uniref:Translational regulator CsrA n=1 Tax=Alkaliphilus peptidifermentans DSM 18978 TaxID=1120976 RepID=A0A1G5JG00_9FIRM|nr:carbon storage regulator CsrA [Alkaliphilus peptidifermentans]SCY86841.1 carbon storage regulator, CsrA [Alkaliphilus peptidifermentans DSM 18978]